MIGRRARDLVLNHHQAHHLPDGKKDHVIPLPACSRFKLQRKGVGAPIIIHLRKYIYQIYSFFFLRNIKFTLKSLMIYLNYIIM